MTRLLMGEISKKQEYIFSSNNPEHIVGASIVIRNLTQIKSKETPDGLEIGDANLIYTGGGAFCIEFAEQ